MKKLSILFVSVLTLGLSLTSCSNDKDDSPASIEGKWEITHQGAVVGTEEVLQPYNSEGCEIPTMIFSNDGKFVDITSEYLSSKCSTYTENGTWSKDGNTLTLKYSDEEIKVTISELSSSTLKIKYTYSEGGLSVSAISVFKKK